MEMDVLRYAFDQIKRRYRRKEWPSADRLSNEEVNDHLARFLEEFPPTTMSMWEEVTTLELMLAAGEMLSPENRKSIQLLLSIRPDRETAQAE